MDHAAWESDGPHPQAPAALSRFAFLVGDWRCDARLIGPDGEGQAFKATWRGRFILDGYVVADEYRMMSESGELIVLGLNLRSYDALRHTWNIKWLNALTGTWTDLALEELGGVSFDGPSVSYAFREPTAGHEYTRATYTSLSPTRFTWRGEQSTDGRDWREFMVIEAYRESE